VSTTASLSHELAITTQTGHLAAEFARREAVVHNVLVQPNLTPRWRKPG
jgi:hypothetical protein